MRNIFRLLCMPGNFWMRERHCIFYVVGVCILSNILNFFGEMHLSYLESLDSWVMCCWTLLGSTWFSTSARSVVIWPCCWGSALPDAQPVAPCDKVSSSGCWKCEQFLELSEPQLLFILLFLLAPSLASDRLLTHTCWYVSRLSLKLIHPEVSGAFLSAALSFWVLYPANPSCSASLNFNYFLISGLPWLCLGSSFLHCSQKTSPKL